MDKFPTNKMEKPDIFARHEELALRRYIGVQRSKVADAVRKLDSPAYFDQYPGKLVPYSYSKLYGPIGPQVASRLGTATGLLGLAPLVNPAVPVLPRGNNILTGRDAAFYWTNTCVSSFISWTYSSVVLPVVPPFAGNPVATQSGDLFDPVIERNGGGQVFESYGYVQTVLQTRCALEIDLYDKKRGRSLTDGRVPIETFLGLGYENKPVMGAGASGPWADYGTASGQGAYRFDVDTEIEPRLYVNEFITAPGAQVTTDTATFNAASLKLYVNVVFIGYNALEEHNVP